MRPSGFAVGRCFFLGGVGALARYGFCPNFLYLTFFNNKKDSF